MTVEQFYLAQEHGIIHLNISQKPKSKCESEENKND